jgi:hypothetical protein
MEILDEFSWWSIEHRLLTIHNGEIQNESFGRPARGMRSAFSMRYSRLSPTVGIGV